MLMVAAPLVRLVALPLNPPADKVTVPVAVEVPPETVTANEIASAEEIVLLEGETVTLGVVFWVPPPPPPPPPQPTTVKVTATTRSKALRMRRPRREPMGRK